MLTGLAAANHAGPAIVLAFILAGIGCIFAGLCYAEFASMIPVSGSAYAYSYATLGEFTAWFIGWNLVLEYLFAASTVAVGWSRYLVKLLEALKINFLPPALTSAPLDIIPGQGLVQTGALVNLPAVFVIAVVTSILVIGIRQSSFVNALVVAIKVGIVVLVIGFGAFYVDLRTGNRSFRRTPANGAYTAGAAFCVRRASSFSLTSASTLSRPRRRRRRIRSATFPLAFSAASSCVRSSTC